MTSIALYEGVIDNYELSPFATSRARSSSTYLSSVAITAANGGQLSDGSSSSGNKTPLLLRSAYSSIIPIAMQKSFVLPNAVTALHHTVTVNGIANKNILLGLRNGQVYTVDMRQIHPRRPLSDPSTTGK